MREQFQPNGSRYRQSCLRKEQACCSWSTLLDTSSGEARRDCLHRQSFSRPRTCTKSAPGTLGAGRRRGSPSVIGASLLYKGHEGVPSRRVLRLPAARRRVAVERVFGARVTAEGLGTLVACLPLRVAGDVERERNLPNAALTVARRALASALPLAVLRCRGLREKKVCVKRSCRKQDHAPSDSIETPGSWSGMTDHCRAW
jgi:hypothetical protein